MVQYRNRGLQDLEPILKFWLLPSFDSGVKFRAIWLEIVCLGTYVYSLQLKGSQNIQEDIHHK